MKLAEPDARRIAANAAEDIINEIEKARDVSPHLHFSEDEFSDMMGDLEEGIVRLLKGLEIPNA